MRKQIVSVDFDGVIHSYESGWQGAHIIPDPPVPGAIQALLDYLDAGLEVAIFSSRSKSIRGRWAMRQWLSRQIGDHWQAGNNHPSLVECECWGDAAGIHRKFKWPWFKPPALLTIDDRAICFDGTWPDVAAIRSFKPWNKRPTLKDAALQRLEG